MTVQQHDRGEEYTIKVEAGIISRATNITFGLYNDASDNLSASDDLNAITTEPETGNYSRKTFSLDSSNFDTAQDENGDWYYYKTTFNWDVGATTEDVDSWFAIISFNGEGDSSETQHLVFTGSLDQAKDLTNHDTLIADNIGRIQRGV